MIDFSKFNNLLAMTSYFDYEDKCRQTIAESRWGKDDKQDVVCPYCGKHHCVVRKDGKFRQTVPNYVQSNSISSP